jgi:hypothetical protein
LNFLWRWVIINSSLSSSCSSSEPFKQLAQNPCFSSFDEAKYTLPQRTHSSWGSPVKETKIKMYQILDWNHIRFSKRSIKWNDTMDFIWKSNFVWYVPSCVFMCALKLQASANFLLQSSQPWGLSPVIR